jgi:hypothetical protein
MQEETNNQFSWTKLGKREVSDFLAHEMLYDYVTGDLDKERRKAVEAHLSSSDEAKEELSKIESGIKYAEHLSETLVSQKIIDKINEPSTYLAVLLKKTNFQRWPSGVKWSLEALVVISLIITTSLFIPWDKISKINPFPEAKETILAEVSRDQDQTDPQKLKALESQEPAQFLDEVKPVAAVTPEVSQPVKAPVAPAPVPETPKVAVETTVVTPPAPATKTPAKPEVEAVAAKDAKKPVGEGALFRGEIAVTNLEMVGPKIRDKIIELGGRKAGEVELGWNKTPKSAYFHFTVPEAKYGELQEFLKTYGKLKIGKEKHPRVMPDGIIRVIITVDEAGQ